MQAEGGHGVLVVGRHEHHQGEGLTDGPQLLQHLHPVEAGHLHVQKHHVVAAGLQGSQGLGAVGALAGHGQGGEVG